MSRINVLDLRKKKADNQKIVMVTAYDATMARLAESAEIDVILVGDSLGMVIQGHEDTLRVTLDQMIYHCQCVVRGTQRTHVVGDLPFMTYQVSASQALTSAGRMVQEGLVQSVKLEGGTVAAEAIRRIVDAGIPVLAHVGLTPQSVHAMGGFRMQGRTEADAERIFQDAIAVEQAGAWGVVLEGIPAELASRITDRLQVPTIGIGAGIGCDGQVLVCNDLLGLDLSFAPKFVKRYARIEELAVGAFRAFANDVRSGAFPGPEHAFAPKREPKIARLY